MGVSRIKTGRVYRCVLAQDAHTHSEEAAYQLLWSLGQPAAGSPDCRYVSISLKQLSERIRMDAKSTQALLRRMVEKLAIELAGERDNHRQTARVWKVYSYAAILKRRRTAGLEWVVRNKGIHFVPEPPPGEPPIGETPVGELPQTPAGVTSPLSYIRRPLHSAILEALREHAPSADEHAAAELAAACRTRAAGASEAEIVHFIHAKAGGPGVRKPLGFLLAAAPRCFEATRGGEERFRREAEAVLDDPGASAEEKAWAMETLGRTRT